MQAILYLLFFFNNIWVHYIFFSLQYFSSYIISKLIIYLIDVSRKYPSPRIRFIHLAKKITTVKFHSVYYIEIRIYVFLLRNS